RLLQSGHAVDKDADQSGNSHPARFPVAAADGNFADQTGEQAGQRAIKRIEPVAERALIIGQNVGAATSSALATSASVSPSELPVKRNDDDQHPAQGNEAELPEIAEPVSRIEIFVEALADPRLDPRVTAQWNGQ